MRPVIILIETSTSLCSTALLRGDEIICRRFSTEPRAHAAMTAPYVKEMLDECGLKVSDCDAVCLSMGPGSYTGLRVGSSTAKGLCFGGGIPLLAVSTLDVLVAQALEEGLPEGCEHIVPMIDARRMEVYTALYSADGDRLTEVAPVVVDAGFADELTEARTADTGDSCAAAQGGTPPCPLGVQGDSSLPRRERSDTGGLGGNAPRPLGVQGDSSPCDAGILFIGDGVAKCEAVLGGPGRWFRQECPRADAMKNPALRELNAGNFRDIAYFEPFYLKDFIATTPKKLF